MPDEPKPEGKKSLWEIVVGAATSLYAIATAFTDFQHFALQTSLLVVAGVCSVAVVSLVLLVAKRPKTRKAKHKVWARLGIVWSIAWRVATISVLCLLAVLILRVTMVSHAITITQESNPHQPLAATVKVHGSLAPTSFTIDVAVLQKPGLSILKFDYSSSCENSPSATLRDQLQNEFERKIGALNFQRPQCLQFSYQLSGPAAPLEMQTTTEPFVRVLMPDEFATHIRYFKRFGGGLWLICVVLFCCLYFRSSP